MSTQLICDTCGRARERMLQYPATGRIICPRCASNTDTHRHEFPLCPESWHDGYDHDARMVQAVTS